MSNYKFTSLLCPTEKVTAEQLEADRRILAFDRTLAQINRRSFMAAGSALGAATLFAGARPADAQTTTPAITDVLNFALNLEYLEANFYLYVTTGAGLGSTLSGGGPTPMNAPGKLTLDATTMAVAQALAQDEMNHINDLRMTITALGGTPVAQPQINYVPTGKPAVTTQAQFIAVARQFTAVGGSAYIGSAQYLVSNVTVLNAAAQILGAEGYHDGALNYLCVTQGVASGAVDSNDVPPSTSVSANPYFTANAQGLPPSRTTSQVLGIVYGVTAPTAASPGTGITSGGFFPAGVNGNIKST